MKHIFCALAVFAVVITVSSIPAFATEPTEAGAAVDATAAAAGITNALKFIFNLVGSIFVGIGGVKTLFGFYELGNAMSHGDPSSKSTAMSSVSSGLVIAASSGIVMLLINMVAPW